MLKGPYNFRMDGTVGGGPLNVIPISAAVNAAGRGGKGPFHPYPVS